MASSSKARQSRREQLEAQRLAQAAKERRLRIMLVVGGVLILVLVIALALWGISSATPKSGTATPPNANSSRNGLYVAPPTKDAPLLEEFQSYTCANCKLASIALGPTIQQAIADGKVNVVVHTINQTTEARSAAMAAVCADFVGKFSDYNKQLFLSQDTNFDATTLRETIPDTVGIYQTDLTTFQACVDAGDTAGFVDAMDAYGSKQGVVQYPTFRLNGEDITEQLVNKDTMSYDPELLRTLLGM